MDDSTRTFADGLVAEFAAAVAAVLGTRIETASAAAGAGTGWILRIALSGTSHGSIAVWIAGSDATLLAQRVTGMDEPPDAATTIDMLGEMWTQAVSAIGLKDPFLGVKSVVSTPEAGTAVAEAIAYELRVDANASVHLAIAGEIITAPAAASVAPAAKPAALMVAEPAGDANARLEVVLDIELPLVVRFGRTLMSIKALADLGPGSIVDMGRSPDEPVEMLIGDRVVARGEVVVVGGNYGVRIMDLVSSVERVRAAGR